MTTLQKPAAPAAASATVAGKLSAVPCAGAKEGESSGVSVRRVCAVAWRDRTEQG